MHAHLIASLRRVSACTRFACLCPRAVSAEIGSVLDGYPERLLVHGGSKIKLGAVAPDVENIRTTDVESVGQAGEGRFRITSRWSGAMSCLRECSCRGLFR